MSGFEIPAEFARTIRALFGDEGKQWIEQLPETVGRLEARWGVQVGAAFPLTYNFVAPAQRADGTPVVLKLAPKSSKDLSREAFALDLVGGQGAIALLARDPAGAMLLERAVPGEPLRKLATADDRRSTEIAASVMVDYWQPVPAEHPFPSVADWGNGFARHRARFSGESGPIPASHFNRAEAIFGELVASSAEPVVLHGDLHHDNILSGKRLPWLIIDPKGVVGEPSYETGALLRNQLLIHNDPVAVTRGRITQLAEQLDLPAERIAGWAYSQAVLAQVWFVEDLGHVSDAMAAAIDVIAHSAPFGAPPQAPFGPPTRPKHPHSPGTPPRSRSSK